MSHLPFCVQGRCKDASCERLPVMVCSNKICLTLEGLVQHMALILWSQTLTQRNLWENVRFWGLAKPESWLQKSTGILKRKLELCDVASHVRYCPLSLVSMTPCVALQSGHSGCDSAHLRERRYTPHYLTDLLYQVSTSLCNHMYLKHHLWEWLLLLHQLDVKGNRSNLRGWERHEGKCREHENSLVMTQEVNWTGGGKFMKHQDPL